MNCKYEVGVLVKEHEYEGALNPRSIAPVLRRLCRYVACCVVCSKEESLKSLHEATQVILVFGMSLVR